jgi:hypothetical protein
MKSIGWTDNNDGQGYAYEQCCGPRNGNAKHQEVLEPDPERLPYQSTCCKCGERWVAKDRWAVLMNLYLCQDCFEMDRELWSKNKNGN